MSTRQIIDFSKFTLKQKIILAFVALVLLIILTNIFSTLSKQDIKDIDYDNVNGSVLVSSGVKTNDREIYWIVDSILYYIKDSYLPEIGVAITIPENSVDDYYDALTPSYKKHMKYSEYKKSMRHLLDKFIVTEEYEGETSNMLKSDDLIKGIYELESTKANSKRYICELNPVDTSVKAYIGIILNTSENTYSIFYIE